MDLEDHTHKVDNVDKNIHSSKKIYENFNNMKFINRGENDHT